MLCAAAARAVASAPAVAAAGVAEVTATAAVARLMAQRSSPFTLLSFLQVAT